MAIFNSYVSLPEGMSLRCYKPLSIHRSPLAVQPLQRLSQGPVALAAHVEADHGALLHGGAASPDG